MVCGFARRANIPLVDRRIVSCGSTTSISRRALGKSQLQKRQVRSSNLFRAYSLGLEGDTLGGQEMLSFETRTLQRSQAWPVRVEFASFFLTEPEKSLFGARCGVNGLVSIPCSVLGILVACWRSPSDVLFGPMMGLDVRRDSPWRVPSLLLQTPARLASGCDAPQTTCMARNKPANAHEKSAPAVQCLGELACDLGVATRLRDGETPSAVAKNPDMFNQGTQPISLSATKSPGEPP